MSGLCDIAGAAMLDILHSRYGCMAGGYTQLQDAVRDTEATAQVDEGVYGWPAAVKERRLPLDEH